MDTTLWKLAGNATLLSRSWDGEHVIYHPESGDTHLVGEAAARVLARLHYAGGPAHALDSASLADTVAHFCHPDEVAGAPDLALIILHDLESLSLVERIA